MAYYWLTPPSRAVFFLSVLLAVLALLVRYANVAIPWVSSHSFETLLIGCCWLATCSRASKAGIPPEEGVIGPRCRP